MKYLRAHSRVISAPMVALLSVWQIAQPLQAATVYWDINGSTPGASGSATADGTWDAVNAFWNNAAGTDTGAAWTSGDTAVFSAGTNATGASAITLSGTQVIGGLVFQEGNVTLGGGTLQLAQNATFNVASSLAATVSSDLTGAFNLVKAGGGTLDYQGNGSGVTGAVQVNSGTLKLSGNGVLTGAASFALSNRAALTLDNTSTNLGDRLSSGAFTSTGGTLNFTHNGAAATSYAETLGALTVNAGALTINTSQAAVGQTSGLVISSLTRTAGGTAFFNGTGLGADTRNSITLSTAPVLTNSILSWAVVSNGTLTSFANYPTSGGSNQNLMPLALASHQQGLMSTWTTTTNARPSVSRGDNAARSVYSLTLDSGINIAGTTATGATAALSADRILTIGSAVLQTGGTSSITANSTSEWILAFGANEALFHVLGNLIIERGNTNNLTGSGGLTKTGAGKLTVSANAITGVVRLNEGVYRAVTNTNALGAGTVELNGGTAELAGDANVSFARNTTVNADSTITIDRVNAAATTVTHTLGTLGIGANVLNVTAGSNITSGTAYGLTFGATTFTGNATFNVANNGAGLGTLTLAAITNTGAATITKQGAGDLITNSTAPFGGPVDIQGGRIGWSNNTAATNITETGAISGAGGLIKTGLSTVNLTGTNTYTGTTTITAGALQAQDGTGLSAGSNLLLNGGVFQSNGAFTRSLGSGAGQVQWAAGANGGFAANGGTLTVTLAGAPAALQWDLPSFVSGTGALLFGSGTADNVVTFTHDIDLNQTGAALSRTVSVVDNTTSTADKAVLSGVLSNSGAAGGLTKTGNGVLELSGANTFTGPVTVTLGTLQFTTASNNGTASNLGQGINNISLGGGILSFIGGTDTTISRGMTLTTTSTLDASGAGTLTYNGPITAFSGGTGFELRLAGTTLGILGSVVTQAGTTADLVKNGTGTWRVDVAQTALGDDIFVNGGTLILNAANAHVGDDLFIRAGTLKLGVNGALTSSMDDLNVSTETATGGVLDIAGTTGSAPTDILLGAAGFSGSIIDSVGGGSIGATGTLAFREGTVSANLTGGGALTKSTAGTVTLSGASAAYTGSATITLGTLALDFTTNNGEKLNGVTVNGGTLLISGNAGAATLETLTSLAVTAGGSHITVNHGAGQTATLNLNGITRTAAGGTVDFVTSSSSTIQTTTGNVFGTILGGYATVSGAKFATVSGGLISGLNSTVKDSLASWGQDDDVTDSTGYTGTVGTLRINSLRFDAAGAASTVAITPGSLLQIRSGGILVTSNVGSGTPSISGGRLISGNGVDLIIHQNNTAADFTISSSIIGYGMTKSGAGTVVLSGTNNYSGQTNVNEGTLRVSGGNAIGDLSAVIIKNGSNALLVLNGNETIGTLSGGGADGGGLDLAGNTLTINETASTTYSGVITGGGVLIKTGPSTLTINTNTNGFSGALVINQGQMTLGDRTETNFNSVSALVINTGILLLDFTGGTEGPSKIANTATVALVNTGAGDGLRANSDRNDASKNETVGDLTLVAGANTITMQASASVSTTARQMTLTAATLTRSNNSTLLVRGNNLGDNALTGVLNSGRVVITASPSGNNFVGGGGAAGSTTLNIVPWAIGSSTATGGTTHGTGNSFVTYAATTGFRPLLLDTEYEQLVAAGGVTAANNVRLSSGSNLTLASNTARTMNSLLVENTGGAGITLAGAGASLNVNSGAFLFVGTQPITVTNFSGITVGAPGEYVLHVPNTAAAGVTINSPFSTTGASLTKSGAGTLILGATTSAYTGATTINQGVLQITGLNNLGNNGSGGLVLNGGTLRFGAAFDPSLVPITLGITSVVPNVTTTTGGTFDTNGFDITLAGSIGNNGNGGLIKVGAGVLTLNAAATYTGLTTVTAGTLRYGVPDALAAGRSVSLGGATLDVAGFTSTLNSLTLTASSTLTGSAALTFTGNTFIDGTAASTLTINNTGLTSFNGEMFSLVSLGTAANTLTINGTGNVAIASQITNGTALLSALTLASTGTVTLSGVNSYTGATTVDSGTVVVTADQTLVGALRFGSANTVTTTSTLDLSNANATFGGLTAQGNSTTANSLIIGATKTLTINGNFSVANNVDGAVTALTMSGGGALVVNGASFTVGNNTGGSSISSKATLDLSALGSFTANLTGAFTVQLTGDNNSADTSSLILSNGANNITAASFAVGASATAGVQSLTLGAGTNVIHANTINLGTGGRDGSSVTFGANATGTVVIRDTAGTGRATFNMGTGGATTGVVGSNVFDVTGHDADLLLGVVNIGTQAGRTSTLGNTFSFNQGTLDMSSLNLGSKGSAGATVTTATFNIGGGVVRSGPIVMATTTTATGAVVANLNITGGSVTLSGSITKGGGAGNDTANFLLTGNTTVLDMGGFTLGGSGANALDSTVLEGGTLRNLAEFNGGAPLVKTTGGILTLDGTSAYTGSSDFREGTVIAAGGRNNRLGNAPLSLGSGSVSATLQLGSAAGASNQTVTALETAGTGTGNAIVGGHSTFSTLTVNLSGTSTFNGTLGGAGLNQNNLSLTKDGAGDLFINQAATLAGNVAVNAGRLLFDGFAGPATTLTSLTLADGTEFSLRGSSSSAHSVYNFSGTGNVVTVGSGSGATLGFALEGAYNTQLNLAAGQTLTVNGTLNTAIYVNGAPNAGQQYVLINGADDGSIFASGTFNLNPVIFNGGSFTYALSKITVGAGEKWVLTPSAQAAAADVWWKGDLTGIGAGVWTASTTTGTGFPTNWDTTQTGGVDALVPPDSGSIVHFSANGAANFATTLGASLTIQALVFHTGGTAISVGSSGGINVLTLGNTVDASGLTLLAGAPNVTLNVAVVLAQAQTWNITDAGSILTLSEGVSGVGPLTLNGNGSSSGQIILTGAGGLFTYSGGTQLVAGRLTLEGGANDRLPTTGALVLGDAIHGALLELGDSVNGASNTSIGSLSSSAATGNAIISGALTLSTLTVNQTSAGTFHGVIGGGGGDQDNLALVKTGAATLVLNNANNYLGATTVREGTLQLGASGSITQTASLSINADAGATATLDVNGRTVGIQGGITLGGADSLSTARIADTTGGGTISLGGNVRFDPTNNPLGASITSNFYLGGAARTFTADDSTAAATDLTITGNVTTGGAATTTGVGMSLLGTGQGAFIGDITLVNGTTDGSATDLTKTGAGAWTYLGTLTTGDDLLISGGTLSILSGSVLNVADDVVADNAGVVFNLGGDGITATLPGNASTSNGLYGRSGAVINILADNVLGAAMDFIVLGDDAQGLGTLNLFDKTITMTRIDLGFDSVGENGVITGTGTITGVTALNIDSGSISVNLTGVGNIDKDNQTMTLSGNNLLTGTTLVREGNLVLDFATNNAVDSKIGTGNLTMGTTTLNDNIASLTLSGNSSAASLQSVGNLLVAGGPSQITLVSNGSQDVTLLINGTLTRTAGTLDISLPNAHTRIQYTGTTGNTQGIVGGWLTLNNSDFATISGGYLQAAAYNVQNDPALWSINRNITNSSAGFNGTVTAGSNTINSLRLDAAADSAITIAGTLTLSSGAILETAHVGASVSTISGGKLASGAGAFFFHQNNTAGTLTIASNLVGGAVVTKNGAGTLVLSGTNSTGVVNIDEGMLRISGGNAISDNSTVNIRNVANTGLEITAGAGNSETIGSLLGDGAQGRVIIGAGATLSVTQGTAGTFAGVISGAGSLTKLGTTALTLTGISTLTGTVRIDAGQITLTGANAQFGALTAIILNGAGGLSLTQDQTSGTSINRILNTATITLNNTIAGIGLAANDSETTADNAEVVGALTLGAGHNLITSNSSVAANVGTLTFDSLAARNNRSTVLVRGTGLGDSAATQRGQIIFTNAPTGANAAVGGGGAAGSTNISIFPWMVGDVSATGVGNSFVRNTGTTNGLKPLTTAEYINDSTSITGTLTANIRYTASGAITSTPTAINSLVLDSATNIALTGSASSMEITSGAILAAGAGNHSIGTFSGLTTGTGRDYTVYVTTATSTLTISTPLTTAVPLVKSGAGTLSLTAAGTGNAFTDVYLNQGTVLADDLDRLGTGTLNFLGGTLKLAAGWTDDLSTKAMNISTGGGTLDVSLVTAGATLLNGIDDTTVSTADSLNIFTRSSGTGSIGQLTIQGSSSYTGTVTFRNSGINGGLVNSVVLNGDTNATLNGNVEIGNLININDTFDVVVALGGNEQIVDTASLTFRGASGENGYFKLMGFTETVAGISDSTREGVIENFESTETGITSSGKLIVDSSNDYSYNAYLRNRASGTAGGALDFEKRGTGTQTLIGDRIIFNGATTISGGTLVIQDVTGWASVITNDSALIINQTTGSRTHAQAISGMGSVTKTGTGTVVLSANNTYTGQTLIEQGVLSFSNSGNLGNGSFTNTVGIANNATLQSTGTNVELGYERTVTLAGTGGTVEVTGTGKLTVSGALVGGADQVLTKAGDGLLVIPTGDTGTTFAGATQVTGGTLQVGWLGLGSSGAGGVTVAAGATLAGSGVIHGTTVINAGGVLQGGDVATIGNVATTVTLNHSFTFDGANTALVVQDGGQIRLGLESTPTYVSSGLADAIFTGAYADALGYINANSGEFTANWNIAPADDSVMDFLNLTGTDSNLSIGNRSGAGFGNGAVVITGLTNAQAGQVFNLIDWKAVTGINGNFDTGGTSIYDATGNVIAGDLDLGALGEGLSWDVSAFAQYGIVVVVMVPEPSRALLILLGLFGLMLRRRRK